MFRIRSSKQFSDAGGLRRTGWKPTGIWLAALVVICAGYVFAQQTKHATISAGSAAGPSGSNGFANVGQTLIGFQPHDHGAMHAGAVPPIKHSRPCRGNGDSDGDGDLDLRDFAAFARCFAGPCASHPCPHVPGNCKKQDMVCDDDVDHLDYKKFNDAFRGPNG